MPIAAIRGTGIHYELDGEGPPIVLATGQGTGPEARAELIAALARQHRVLSYDQRGTGRSERAPQGQSIEELASDIAGLMDHVGFDRAHLMGMSTGTGMATTFAALQPGRVGRLVLAAPWTHGDADLHVLQNMRKAAARTMPADHYVHLNALLIYPPEYRRDHFDRFEVLARKALAAPQDAAGIAARLDAILRFDARPYYPRIASRTLVLGARDDLVMPSWHAEHAARAIAHAQLVLLDHGGHLFPETRTAEFLASVLPFLAQDKD